MSGENNQYTTVEELDAIIAQDEWRLREIEQQAARETGSAEEGAAIARRFADLIGTNILKLQRAAAERTGRISRVESERIWRTEMRKKGLVSISEVLGRAPRCE